MEQDFNRKITICVRKDLPEWQVLNTVAHISGYLSNKMGKSFATGDFFTTADGINIPRNSQYGMVILEATEQKLKNLLTKASTSDVRVMPYIRQMIDHGDDSELEKEIAQLQFSELEYLGVGLFGNKDAVQALTKNYRLWRG